MGQDTSREHDAPDAHAFSCTCCGQSLRPHTIRIAHRYPRALEGTLRADLSEDEKAQQLTSMAVSEAARTLANLLLLCDICHRSLYGGELEPSAAQPQTFIETIPEVATDLMPTPEQFRAAVRVVKWAIRMGGGNTPSYAIERTFAAMLIERWREVAQQPGPSAYVQQARVAGTGRPQAVEVAGAAHSAAVELRRTYLSADTDISIADRTAAVIAFGRQWLGWRRRTVPQEKVQALIDALLSDEWPSESQADGDNLLPRLHQLYDSHHKNWRPFYEGRINGKHVISHSIQLHAHSGEGTELIELIAAPGFEVDLPVPIVRRILSELDPLEQDVWWTYADLPDRRSWTRAAELNGQSGEFGVNRVRRKILRRLEAWEHEHVGPRYTTES